jgi:hypothetical protein
MIFQRSTLGALLLAALGTEGAPLVGLNLAPLGVHPTTGVNHGEANTLVFLDLFKHATPFTRYQAERDNDNDGIFSPEYDAARQPTIVDGYPTVLPSGVGYPAPTGKPWRSAVKATIGAGGNALPHGRYARRILPPSTHIACRGVRACNYGLLHCITGAG